MWWTLLSFLVLEQRMVWENVTRKGISTDFLVTVCLHFDVIPFKICNLHNVVHIHMWWAVLYVHHIMYLRKYKTYRKLVNCEHLLRREAETSLEQCAVMNLQNVRYIIATCRRVRDKIKLFDVVIPYCTHCTATSSLITHTTWLQPLPTLAIDQHCTVRPYGNTNCENEAL
jgi:hypothetical protein